MTMLTKLDSKLVQQSAMLGELLIYARKSTPVIEKPYGTPNFPICSLEELNAFNTSLESNGVLRDYIVRIRFL